MQFVFQFVIFAGAGKEGSERHRDIKQAGPQFMGSGFMLHFHNDRQDHRTAFGFLIQILIQCFTDVQFQ